jgi:general secretion pathway protein D
VIKAIAAHASTNILSAPQILAMDNTEAVFEMGDTVPVRNQTNTTTGIPTFSNGTPQEAKLTLKITPQINKVTRFVRLKINQKIDDFKQGTTQDTTSGLGLPTTTRSAVTEVMVRDRDTVVMGGMLRDKETVSNSKIPILGDIPVLGWLFKNKSRQIDKVNLLFFMTPKILAPYAKTASVNTREILNKRRDGMKNMFEEDETDPNEKVTSELSAKLDRQVEGPLYDLTDAEYYKNLNSQSVGRESNDDDETEVETPDYHEIKKSMENPNKQQ